MKVKKKFLPKSENIIILTAMVILILSVWVTMLLRQRQELKPQRVLLDFSKVNNIPHNDVLKDSVINAGNELKAKVKKIMEDRENERQKDPSERQ